MRKKKGIKYITVFVITALGVSLILNIYLVTKVGELGNQVNQIMFEQQYLSSEVSGQTNQIMSVLDEFQQQQSWLGTINIEATTTTSVGDGELTFKWLVKELEGTSDVMLNYAFTEDDQYTSTPATEIEQGLFEATIPFESSIGPVWKPTEVYGVTKYVNEFDKGLNFEIEEEQYEKTAFNYYISVLKEDGSYKNGDIQTGYLHDFSTQMYGFVQTGVYLEEKEFRVYLNQDVKEGNENLIEQVFLLKYQQDELIGEEELDMNDSGPGHRSFEKNNIENYKDMRLWLKVVYPNGETFEKEILSGDKEN